MAEAQLPAPVDTGSAARLPVPAFAARFEPLTQVLRQPAVQRALPAIATSTAIGIAALAWFMTQSAPQTQLFAGLEDADRTDERRVGQECVCPGRSGGTRYHQNKQMPNQNNNTIKLTKKSVT